MSINLLPPKLKARKKLEKKLHFSLWLIILAIALVLALGSILFLFNKVNEQELTQIGIRTDAYQLEAEAYSSVKEKISSTQH